MSQNKIILPFVLIISLLSGYLFSLIINPNEILNRTLGKITSPYILMITDPVPSLPLKIEKINGNILAVSYIPRPKFPSSSVPPPSEKVKYEIVVGPNTTIESAAIPVPYLFKPAQPPSNKLSLNDLKVDNMIEVASTVDFRLVEKKINTLSIRLLDYNSTLQGKVETVGSDRLVVKNNYRGTKYPTITVLISADTEISRNSVSSASASFEMKPELLTIKDIKPGDNVMVYTGQNILEAQQVKALRIEPLAPPPIPPPTNPAGSLAPPINK